MISSFEKATNDAIEELNRQESRKWADIIMAIFGLFVSIVGLIWVYKASGWYGVGGLSLCLLGNNISIRRKR